MNMPWQVVILLMLIPAYIISPILNKKLVGSPSRPTSPRLKAQRQYWMYSYCFLLSLTFLLYTQEKSFDLFFFLIMAIGFINSFAFYFYWQAISINLSKASIFKQPDDLVGIALGYLLLNELKFINPAIVAGMLLIIASALLFIWPKNKSKQEIQSLDKNKTLIKLIFYYSFIWGLAIFLMRYFAIQEISFTKFLLGWYGGAFLGSALLAFISSRRISNLLLFKKQTLITLPLAFITWLSMILSYWAFNLAPITVIQPISMASEMILPCLIGLFYFKESKELTKQEYIAILIGFAGGIIIAFSY